MRQVFGYLLLAAGVAGLLLPFVPGVPLLAAGVVMLGRDHPLVRAGRTWLQKAGLLKTTEQPGAPVREPANRP
jgi:hypothetical protein